MARFYFKKDPDAVLDWLFNWTDYLESGETISSFSVTCDDGLTVDSSSNTDTSVTVWLSGGTVGTSYRVTVEIVTSASRTDDRSISIRIAEL